jgi:hypothetical protein
VIEVSANIVNGCERAGCCVSISSDPRPGRPPHPFIDQGEAAYNRVALLRVQCCGTGTRYLQFDGHPDESWPLYVSWWPLCWSKGGFDGGRAGGLVWSSPVYQLEGPVDRSS